MRTRHVMILFSGLGAAVCITLLANDMPAASHGKKKSASSALYLKDGDIVFQYSGSAQCAAIAQATHSPYTHCGIVFLESGRPMVWEAVGPVLRTPFKEWTHHGVNEHYVVKRLKDRNVLSPEVLDAMRAEGEREMGRPYDIFFSMNEEDIYCSELVYKVYDRGAHIAVGKVERFGDMDFTGGEARRVLHDRFGSAFPAEQAVITPASIFGSSLLMTVDSVGAPPPVPLP